MKIKKWFVFAAMLVDRHRKENSGFNSMNYDGKYMMRGNMLPYIQYQRNKVRFILYRNPAVTHRLIELSFQL